MQQERYHLNPLTRIAVSGGRPDRRRRDIDNIGKALLDLLVAHQVIEEDSRVVSLDSIWDDNVTAGRVLNMRRNPATSTAHSRLRRMWPTPIWRCAENGMYRTKSGAVSFDGWC